jgi:hypothetical protein
MPSHAINNAVKSCWQRCCRGDLATMRCRCLVMLGTMLPSHAGDGTVGAAWPRCDATQMPSHTGGNSAESCWRGHCGETSARRDVDTKSCWRQCHRVMLSKVLPGDLAVARCRYQVMLVTMLVGYAVKGPTIATWPWCDLDTESCWRRRCWGDLAAA